MAFKWENRFSEEELREGFLLFQNGAVRSKTKRGNVYTIKVSDFLNAVVIIDISTGLHDCKCSCWEYRTSKRCRHIVAGLYSIDMKPEESSFSGEKRVMPFSNKKNEDDSDYHYYDMSKIASNVKLIEYNNQKAIRMRKECGSKVLLPFSIRMEKTGSIPALHIRWKSATRTYHGSSMRRFMWEGISFGGEIVR